MFRYFVKRLLYFIPTLIFISFVGFGLTRLAPGDPVENHMMAKGITVDELGSHYDQIYEENALDLGLNCPTFYLSFTSKAYPDSLMSIANYSRRMALTKLIGQYGNWNEIDEYYQSIKKFHQHLLQVESQVSREKKISISRPLSQLYIAYKDGAINGKLAAIKNKISLSSTSTQTDSIAHQLLGAPFEALETAYQKVKLTSTPGLLKVPLIRWNGLDNQYHHWASRFIKGDFGYSNFGAIPVWDRLKIPIFWTMIMSFVAMLISFLIAIPLGVFSAAKRNSLFDRIATIIVFVLFSLPLFWIATMAVIFLTTPEYGMKIFPSIGLGDVATDAPFWERFKIKASHLILPIICLIYPSLAFISRQIRGGMGDVLQQDFVRTARAKGLSNKKVIYKHAFRNSLLPLITMLSRIFPALVVGSVVVEVIFNIPGMGNTLVRAIRSDDWNIVFTVLMLSAILTLLGNFIADILYTFADPRISFRAE